MIPLPPDPLPGQPIYPWAREVNRALRQLRPSPGPGIRITEASNNLIISADPGRSSSSSSSAPDPCAQLKVTLAPDPDHSGDPPAPTLIFVAPGWIANLTPAAVGFPGAGSLPITFPAATGIVYARIEFTPTTGAVTSASIEFDSTLPADDEGLRHIPLASISPGPDPGTFLATPARCGNIAKTQCRDWFSNPPTMSVIFY